MAPTRESPVDDAATILVVDDSESSRLLLRAILEKNGWTTLEAADGRAGLESIARDRPDLVLLDAMMPGLSGFDVCDRLRELGDPTPVLFLSALTSSVDRVEALKRGAVDFLTKPCEAVEVEARIRTHLRLRRDRERLEAGLEALRRRQQVMDDEMRAAAEVQRSLLPDASTRLPGLAVAWRFLPCSGLGGDLLRFHAEDGTRSLLWILDVAGHGTSAALLAAAVWQALSPEGRSAAGDPAPGPAAILAAVGSAFPVERFEKTFTMAVLDFDAATGVLRWSSAGHPPPLLLRDGAVHELSEGGPLIGLSRSSRFDEGRTVLAPGERVLVVTDGVLDAAGADGRRYGAASLASLLRRTRGFDPEAACDALVDELLEHRGAGSFDDDIAAMFLERSDHPRSGLHATFEGDLRGIRAAAAALRGWAGREGLAAGVAARLETGVVEALNNAVLHGDPGTDVTLEARRDGDCAEVRVAGSGPAFDPDSPARPAEGDWPAEGGRGLAILRACFDEVDFSREGRCNVVRLRTPVAAAPRDASPKVG